MKRETDQQYQTLCTHLELYLDVLDGLQLVLVLLSQELQLLLQPLTHVLHVAALVLRPRQRALQVRQLCHRLDLLLQHPRQRFLQHTQNSWILYHLSTLIRLYHRTFNKPTFLGSPVLALLTASSHDPAVKTNTMTSKQPDTSQMLFFNFCCATTVIWDSSRPNHCSYFHQLSFYGH